MTNTEERDPWYSEPIAVTYNKVKLEPDAALKYRLWVKRSALDYIMAQSAKMGSYIDVHHIYVDGVTQSQTPIPFPERHHPLTSGGENQGPHQPPWNRAAMGWMGIARRTIA